MEVRGGGRLRYSERDAAGIDERSFSEHAGHAPFSNQNGGSGYAQPPVQNNDYSIWDGPYTFYDGIGQAMVTQKPPVYFEAGGPPYGQNTVYFSGGHTWNAGSSTTGSGFLVYTGSIRFYSDLGDNNP